MRKFIIWAVIITALALYGITVYGWLIEGDANRMQQAVEQDLKDLQIYGRNIDKR